MWITHDIVESVEKVCRVHYISYADCQRWNERRDSADLRLMSGWAWTSKDGRHWRQSMRSQTAAYIDAWYALVAKREAPSATRRPLRVVERRAA